MTNRIPQVLSLFVFSLALAASVISAQTTTPGTPQFSSDEKSDQIVKRAIEVLGGANYLKVRTITGRGFFTPFQDGMSQVPVKFLDYIVFPDKERSEFT
ncbi:MAG TPA: hypothetical protein VGN86_10230, partial [Pyrinomonadaceae bacterium]|nr:hypothetical protein [Pyrinomonadaceae bacterium]